MFHIEGLKWPMELQAEVVPNRGKPQRIALAPGQAKLLIKLSELQAQHNLSLKDGSITVKIIGRPELRARVFSGVFGDDPRPADVFAKEGSFELTGSNDTTALTFRATREGGFKITGTLEFRWFRFVYDALEKFPSHRTGEIDLVVPNMLTDAHVSTGDDFVPGYLVERDKAYSAKIENIRINAPLELPDPEGD